MLSWIDTLHDRLDQRGPTVRQRGKGHNDQENPSLVTLLSQAVEQAVHEGQLRAGARLPSVRQLATRLGVSTFTVAEAYASLVGRQLLVSRPGAGYFVQSSRVAARRSASELNLSPLVADDWLSLNMFAQGRDLLAAGCGWLPLSWYAENNFHTALRQATRIAPEHLASYGHPLGYAGLRQWLAQDLSPRLGGLDGLQRVLTLGGFSKTIAPAMRVGYVACPPALVQALARVKMACGLTTSEINERAAARVLADPSHRRYLERIRHRLATARERVVDALLDVGLEPLAMPDSGLYVCAGWPAAREGLGTPTGARAVAQAALKEGIALAPGDYFLLEQPATRWFRFNVAHANDPRLMDFLRRRHQSGAPG